MVEVKLSSKVMNSYGQFVNAMNDVQQLGDDLHDSLIICKDTRSEIISSKEMLAINGMTIVGLYRRRQKQFKSLTIMVKLQQFIKQRKLMVEMTKTGDFAQAFNLCINIRDLYNSLSGLSCVSKIAETLKQEVDDLRVCN